MTTYYTAISFAPVQSFIEKSRKLRDLYGASGILSYLSSELIREAPEGCQVISPGLINIQQGTPNRILIRGHYPRNDVANTLSRSWQSIMQHCRIWIETTLKSQFPPEHYHWEEEWAKWGRYHWEIFWGQGDSIKQAMEDLERRKLRRDWVAVNWTGESSSLSGTDAIAWPSLGALDSNPGRSLSRAERTAQSQFYEALATALEGSTSSDLIGRFLAPNERLSIPELAKRLVTRSDIARQIGISELDRSFTEIHRNTRDGKGQWTGWFMGDGDRIGEALKSIAASASGDDDLREFSQAMRQWGQDFIQTLPREQGRIVYAGGDDFLGVLYGQSPDQPIPPHKALDWLNQLNQHWQLLNQQVEAILVRAGLDQLTLSVGFVWVAPDVPQRDVLQHCREAQKQAKKAGRDRLTIRIVFNSGHYVQWTCRWQYLSVLQQYCDRDGNTHKPNWAHIFTDWAQLKARHAIPSKASDQFVDDYLAIELFDIYFSGYKQRLTNESQDILGAYDNAQSMIEWIEGVIYTGWYLTPA